MKRVKKDEQWSLFCPNEAPGLQDVWGEEFEALYEKFVFTIIYDEFEQLYEKFV